MIEEYNPEKHGAPVRRPHGSVKAQWLEIFRKAAASPNGVVTSLPDDDHTQIYAKRLGYKVEVSKLSTGRWLVKATRA